MAGKWNNEVLRSLEETALFFLPVLQREPCEFSAVVDPFEFQGPAALCHAGENQAVSLQVNLRLWRLHLKVRWHVIYCQEGEEERQKGRKRERKTVIGLLV